MTDTTAGSDVMFRPALELAGLVRRGEIAARELVETSLARIDALNPELNAFVDVFHDEALAAAAAVHTGDERPFAGVPVAIKNNRAVAGHRLTYGADFMGDWPAPYDHNVVRRLRAAGFIVVGTTTLPEWGILPWTNTKRFGATRNPWDPARTSGGSSGGSASAVAAGMVPIAQANDGGGSTRIPAACCGLVGLKPQRNRTSFAPEIGQSFLAVDGVLTRTVADTAAALDAISGPEVGDAGWAPPPPEPFAAAAERAPERLRVAVTTFPPLEVKIEAAPAQAARDAAALLESFGHDVEEADPPWRQPQLGELFTALFAPLEIFARGLLGWMDRYDVVVTPALAEAPVRLDDVHWQTDDPMGLFTRSAAFTPFTAIANVTGQPAISVPLAEHDGLPVGVQLFGRPAQEGALLAVAAQLEAARPWAGRRPSPA